jgi:sec-independent protein translocase protein TatC
MQEYSFKEHLTELKNRLFIILALFLCVFSICYFLSNDIYKIILTPLVDILGDKARKIIYTGLTEAFFAYIKLSAFTAFIIIFPFCYYQIYAFLKPGLHRKEKIWIAGMLLFSSILFYIGCFFMFFVVMPKAWLFFAGYENTELGMPLVLEARISEYLSLVIQLTLSFGIAFQLPIAIILLSATGLVSVSGLKRKRRIVTVIIFIISAVFTPPDVFSQIALAIPMILLYEISIILCKFLKRS